MHRDTKCHLMKDCTVKLGDLVTSKFLSCDMQATRVRISLYLAPEMVKQLPYDFKIDV